MPTLLQCPNPDCRVAVAVPEGFAGRTIRCERCGLTIPIHSEAARRLPIVIGRYQIRERLGAGAFGVVYRAFDPRLKREVALKVLRSDRVLSTDIVARFRREARTAANLHHPHIVQVYHASCTRGRLYMVSEFIKGHSLSDAIPREGMEPRRAAELTAQLAEALGHAHQQGVVHRDVKPANAILDEQDSLHLTDFGMARGDQEDSVTPTVAGTLLGTPAYMAPEQARGEKATNASDLYSAGVVLYKLLTGRVPFTADNTAALLYRIVHETPPPPSRHRPGLDARLETICLKAMEKKPEDRFQSGKEMAAALLGWTPGVPRCQAGVAAPLMEEIVNSFGMRLKLIQPGKFLMGSPVGEEGRYDDELPQHFVEITRPFYMGIYPVTQEEYVRVTGKNNPSYFCKEREGDKVRGLDTARFPVEAISWREVVVFCEDLNQRDATCLAGWRYGLPTEAQWEYACRAGTATAFSFSDEGAGLGEYAWFSENSGGRTHEVGGKIPNRWGLYDMAGNVWEWIADWYGDYPDKELKDPKGPVNGEVRVLRGGCWVNQPWSCRSTYRGRFAPGVRFGYVGCRVALCLE